MIQNKFQGAEYIEILSAQGSSNLSAWDVTGNVKKAFDKSVKTYVYTLPGGSSRTKITFPADSRQSMELSQKILILQVFVPSKCDFLFELTIRDSDSYRRRLVFSTNTREQTTGPNLAKVPLSDLCRDQWLNLAVVVDSLVSILWPSIKFQHIDSITLAAHCRIRKVFSIRDCCSNDSSINPDNTANNTCDASQGSITAAFPMIPKACEFAVGVPHTNQMVGHSQGSTVAVDNNIVSAAYNEVEVHRSSKLKMSSSISLKSMRKSQRPEASQAGTRSLSASKRSSSLPSPCSSIRSYKSVTFADSPGDQKESNSNEASISIRRIPTSSLPKPLRGLLKKSASTSQTIDSSGVSHSVISRNYSQDESTRHIGIGRESVSAPVRLTKQTTSFDTQPSQNPRPSSDSSTRVPDISSTQLKLPSNSEQESHADSIDVILRERLLNILKGPDELLNSNAISDDSDDERRGLRLSTSGRLRTRSSSPAASSYHPTGMYAASFKYYSAGRTLASESESAPTSKETVNGNNVATFQEQSENDQVYRHEAAGPSSTIEDRSTTDHQLEDQESTQPEILDLIYDSSSKCYTDPRTNRYYELIT